MLSSLRSTAHLANHILWHCPTPTLLWPYRRHTLVRLCVRVCDALDCVVMKALYFSCLGILVPVVWRELAWPSYEGNRYFRTNLTVGGGGRSCECNEAVHSKFVCMPVEARMSMLSVIP